MSRYVVLTLTLALLLLLPSRTDAEVEDRMVLVQALLGEAGWVPCNDHPAILHVLERQRSLPSHAGYSLTRMAQAYAQFLDPKRDPDLPHRAAISALTIDSAPSWAVRLVDTFLADPAAVKDPCQGKAWHWGSPEETLTDKTRQVDCGHTKNVFLTLKKRAISVQ